MSETELVARLERLERAHRRLKGVALAALVLAIALATIGATQLVPQTIRAHQFEVVDNSGKVRATMRIDGISLMDAQGDQRMGVTISPTGAGIDLFNAQGDVVAVRASSSGPDIMLADAQGFIMDLGSSENVNVKTGVAQQTSAASIVMFGNDKEHRVVWKAP